MGKNLYNIQLEENNVLSISFGKDSGSNDEIVLFVNENFPELPGGELLKITGPASLPVAFTIAHKVNHLYGAVAVFDPKLQAYVVAVSHSNSYYVGDLLHV